MSDSLRSLIQELQRTRDELYTEASTLDQAVEVLEHIHAERDLRVDRNTDLRKQVGEWVRLPPTKR